MKTKLIDLLYDLLEPTVIKSDYNARCVGRKCVLKMDENRLLEIFFADEQVMDHYDTLILKLTHKINGPINSTHIYFGDVLEPTRNGVAKRIWKDDEFKWSGQPTEKDFNILRREVEDYIAMWR